MNYSPSPYIQNTNNWCWVVCAELAGAFYASRHPQHVLHTEEWRRKYPFGVKVSYSENLCMKHIGSLESEITIDAAQWAIARHVIGSIDRLASDEDKEKAIRFAITGDIHAQDIATETIGSYYELIESGYNTLLDEWLKLPKPCCGIGNMYLRESKLAHSVVLRGNNEQVILYDPATGISHRFAPTDIFIHGIQCNRGIAVISWMQIIREK